MCPKTKEQFAEIRTQSEQKILDAALELFANKGFKATSISQIAKAAGVSKGLMYNYFDSKTELLRKIVRNAINDGIALMDHAINDFEHPEEELEHLIMDSIDYYKEHKDFRRLMSMLSFQEEVMASIADLLEKNTQFSIESCAAVFEKLGAQDPVKSALLLGATLEGIILLAQHLKEAYPIDEMARMTLQTFLQKNSIHRSK